jgi:molybdenum cofactor cytidylyltransferase
MQPPVVGIVLAAGASSRMTGTSKLLLPYQGTTILAATIEAVEASRLDRVVIVTGSDAAVVEASIEARRSMIVSNPEYRRGNMSSMLVGTDAEPDASAFVLVPGDLPTIRTDVINAMVALWEDQAPWAAVTAYADDVAHPFLVSAAAVAELRPYVGEKVLGRFLVDSPDDRVVRLDVPFDAPVDVNTREDYLRLVGE